MVGKAPDRDDPCVDADADDPSFVTAAIRPPPTAEVTEPIPSRVISPPPEDENTERAPFRDLEQLPADGEMQTIERAVDEAQAQAHAHAGEALDIPTAAGGMLDPPRSSRSVHLPPGPSTPGPDDWDEPSNASLITPRFTPSTLPQALAEAERALAHADRAEGTAPPALALHGPDAGRVPLPADNEPDTMDAALLSPRIGAGKEADDRTTPKASVDGLLSEPPPRVAQDEPPLAPPRAPIRRRSRRW